MFTDLGVGQTAGRIQPSLRSSPGTSSWRRTTLRIAMISEHASPLLDGGDATGGVQRRHVADLSCALSDLGHDVRFSPRRDRTDLAETVTLANGVLVVHVPAG